MRASLIHTYYYSSQGGGEPSYTNWWQGLGDVVPASANYTVYDPLSAASLAESYVNLANPGTRNAAAPTAAPAHTQGSGWSFLAASSQYLSTGITNLGDASTVIIWVEDSAGVYVMGYFTQTSPARWLAIRPFSSTQTAFHKGAAGVNATHQTAGSILAMNNTHGYRNGNAEIALAAWTGVTPGLNITIGGRNLNGSSVDQFFTGRVLRVAMYDIALNDAQIEAVTYAMFDYNQPANDAYTNTVLALNPVCYWPLNHAVGSPVFDISGNKAHGMVYRLSAGQPGKHGNALGGTSDENNYVTSIGNWAAKTGLNLNNF